MRAGGAEDKLARQFAAGGNQRPRQAAAAGACQRKRMLAVLVGHQGRHRAKGFNGVNRRGFIRLRAVEQRRREKGSGRAEVRLSAKQRFAAGGNQFIDALLYVPTLLVINQRPHLNPFLRRVADGHFMQAGDQGIANRIDLRQRDDDAADSGTFLPGFRRHLADHFPDKQRELRLLRRDVFA